MLFRLYLWVVPVTTIFFRLGQFENTELCSISYSSPIQMTLAGIDTDSNEVQSLKAIVPIFATPFGRTTFFKL